MRDISSSATLRVVIEGYANCTAMMAVVLTDDRLRSQFPESSVVVAAGCDEVRGVGAECAVPHPSLVAVQFLLKGKRLVLLIAVQTVLHFVIEC